MSATSLSPRFTEVVSDTKPMGSDLLPLKQCARQFIVAGPVRSMAELAVLPTENDRAVFGDW